MTTKRRRNADATLLARAAASTIVRGFAVTLSCQPGAISFAPPSSQTTSSATESPARLASQLVSVERSTTKPCAIRPSGVLTSRTATSAGVLLYMYVRHSNGEIVIVTGVESLVFSTFGGSTRFGGLFRFGGFCFGGGCTVDSFWTLSAPLSPSGCTTSTCCRSMVFTFGCASTCGRSILRALPTLLRTFALPALLRDCWLSGA